tara:strand:+ start:6005 stop:6571 length:567 start_codon:yes stop_codon:yes gene_type:complete
MKALFLDRDGIINYDYNHVYKIDEFIFKDDIFELCKYFQKNGYLIIIITNQAGIAKGFYKEEDYNILTNWMLNKFNEQGINISKVFHCPHHPEFTGSCYCRKPNPKMILDAKKKFKINLKKSLLVGDNLSDINAGINAGIGENFLLSDDKANANFLPMEIIKDNFRYTNVASLIQIINLKFKKNKKEQ